MKLHFSFPLIAISVLLLCNCNKPIPIFQHNFSQGPTPWTSEPTAMIGDQFTFAIIGDLNGEERPGIFNVAVEQLKILRPEFVLSVGDLIDGGTEDTVRLKMEFDNFDARALKMNLPFFHVGGNNFDARALKMNLPFFHVGGNSPLKRKFKEVCR